MGHPRHRNLRHGMIKLSTFKVGWASGSKCRHCEVFTIHRFVHQSACHESSGCASTAKFHDCLARVFLDGSRKTKVHNINILLWQKWPSRHPEAQDERLEGAVGGNCWQNHRLVRVTVMFPLSPSVTSHALSSVINLRHRHVRHAFWAWSWLVIRHRHTNGGAAPLDHTSAGNLSTRLSVVV